MLGCVSSSTPQNSGGPQDVPFTCGPETSDGYYDLIRPSIEQARSTYPEARRRWEQGLPRGQAFLVTTWFRHSEHEVEQVFVRVNSLVVVAAEGRDDLSPVTMILGQIISAPVGPGFKQGDQYRFSEEDVIDWTIQHADGTEEGNAIGKFLDEYGARCPAA